MQLTNFCRPIIQVVITVCILLLSNQIFAQPVNGLVAYWPMDGNFTDSGPNNIATTNTNSTPTANAAGVSNAAMAFVNTGSNATQYASHAINSNVNFTAGTDFTYDFMMYYSSPDKSGGLYDNNINYFGCGMYVWYSNGFLQLQFNYRNASVGTTNGALQLNTWTHITCRRSAGVLAVFVNGVLNASTNEGTQTPSYTYAPKFGTMWYHIAPYLNYNGFNGKMDEFRIYNRALTTDEISQLQCLHFPASSPGVSVTGDITFCEGSSALLTSSIATGNQWYKDNAIIPGETGQSLNVYNSGAYTVINTQSSCASLPSNPVTITALPKPQLGNDTVIALLCPGNTINLQNVFNTGSLTTIWNTPDPANAGTGNYTLIASAGNGCKDTALVNVVIETAVWTGSTSSNWYDASNWSNGSIPSEKTHVIISGTTPNTCTISSGNPRVASVQVKNGAILQTLNNIQLEIAAACVSLPVN